MGLRLSGWSRLWIVSSMLLLALVAGFTYQKWPSTTEAEIRLYLDVNRAIYEQLLEPKGAAGKISAKDMLRLVERDSDFIERGDWLAKADRQMSESPNVDFGAANARYERALRGIADDRKELILRSSLLWVIPVILLYVIGWSIGWVRRGFKVQT
jgi:hypothetical protein